MDSSMKGKRLQKLSDYYLVKSHIRHPDIVLLVHSYHVR